MGFNYAKYKAAVTGSPLNKNGFGPKEQEKIKAAPTKMYGKKASAVKNYKKGYYGA